MRREAGSAAVAAVVRGRGRAPAHRTQPVTREVKATPGRDHRVGVFTDIQPDCTSGPLPAIRLAAPPAHGAVTVKRGMLKATNFKQCLATEVPAFVAFYRAGRRIQRLRSVRIGNQPSRRPQAASTLPGDRVRAPGGGQGISSSPRLGLHDAAPISFFRRRRKSDGAREEKVA